MPMKKHKPEQIVTLLRQIEVEIANGETTHRSRSTGIPSHLRGVRSAGEPPRRRLDSNGMR